MTQPQHWQANNIREVRFKRMTKRVIERSTIIGQRGSKYSVLGFAVIEPTLEYPDLAISVSLSNGASYTYSQIKPEEFNNLIDTLKGWQDLYLGVERDLQEKSNACKERRAAWDAQQAALEEQMQQLRVMQAGIPQPPESFAP